MNEPEWIVEAPTEALEALEQSFFNGPIDERGLSPLLEKKIAQIKGLKVEIFANEHPPPHFRISYQGEVANYRISDGERINGELGKWDRNVKKWHEQNKSTLIKQWDEMRPRDCPVGKYREP